MFGIPPLLALLFTTANSSPLLKLGFLTLNLDVRSVTPNQSACIEALGCFSNGPPYYDPHRRPLSLLPFDRGGLDVRFYLYSRRNPALGEELVALDSSTIKRSSFNPKSDTKIIVHGLMDNIKYGGWLEDIKREYLLLSDCNVILVDWARANRLPYEQAVANARAVGAELALLLQKLIETTGTDSGKFHILGHSLGAHVAGYTGERTPGIARITGLDPAGPYFTGTDPKVRLDPSDAKFVDVIHTDASTSVLSGLGTVDSVGHVDFYPNGGNDQPGCSPISNVPSIFYKGLARSLTNVMGFCDHMRAGDLFASSIRSGLCSPVGLKCSGWSNFLLGRCGDCNTSTCLPMGEEAQAHFTSDMTGMTFFLKTTDSEPFCLFQYRISVLLDQGNKSTSPVGEAYIILHGDKGILHTKLSSGPETFHPGSYMTYLVTGRRDLGTLEKARFYWKEDEFLSEGHNGRNRLYLKNIVVSPLQTSNKLSARSSKQGIFCGDSGEEVFPDHEKLFMKKNKC